MDIKESAEFKFLPVCKVEDLYEEIPIKCEIPEYDSEKEVSPETQNELINLSNKEEYFSKNEVDPFKIPVIKLHRILWCNQCQEEFKNAQSLKDHLAIHTECQETTGEVQDERPFKCQVCAKCYETQNDLNLHNQIHYDEKPYECEKCERSFRRLHDLRIHSCNNKKKRRRHLCKFCQNSFHRKIDLNKHLKKHVDENPFECNVCKKRLMSDYRLKMHKRLHLESKYYECDYCKEKIRYRDNLRLHIKRHMMSINIQKCETCGITFRRSYDLKVHMSIHTGLEPYECKICNEKFSKLCDLKTHKHSHENIKRYVCNVCFKVYLSQSSMKYHELTHLREKPFKCEICKKSFLQDYRLKKHQRIHTGEKLFPCKICKAEWRSLHKLKMHLKIHEVSEPHKCRVCSIVFMSLYDLKIHMRSHPEYYPFACNFCEESFFCPSDFASHVLTHEKPPTSILKKDHTFVIGCQAYTCPICKNTFGGAYYFDVHIPEHLERKKNQCEICELFFSSKASLKAHVTTHTDEKSFMCDICPESLTTKQHLQRHQRKHFNGNLREFGPYPCEICKFQFQTLRVLEAHACYEDREAIYQCSLCNLKFKTRCYFNFHKRACNYMQRKVPQALGKKNFCEFPAPQKIYLKTNFMMENMKDKSTLDQEARPKIVNQADDHSDYRTIIKSEDSVFFVKSEFEMEEQNEQIVKTEFQEGISNLLDVNS